MLLEHGRRLNIFVRIIFLMVWSMSSMIHILDMIPLKVYRADNLKKKYITEDAGTKKFSIDNFPDFNMVEKNSISTQIHEYQRI